MTTVPMEPSQGPGSEPGAEAASSPAADAGVGGPADETGPAGELQTPPEYPDEVDPAAGPVGAGGGGLGDLQDPGVTPG